MHITSIPPAMAPAMQLLDFVAGIQVHPPNARRLTTEDFEAGIDTFPVRERGGGDEGNPTSSMFIEAILRGPALLQLQCPLCSQH